VAPPDWFREGFTRERKALMKISELAIAVYLYERVTPYDKSYIEFLDAIGDGCDLGNRKTRDLLYQWLNKWGCRLDRKHKKNVSRELLKWHKEFGSDLPSASANLWDLTGKELDHGADLFNSLVNALKRASDRREWTAAAKIMFATRPNVFPPWDGAIRKAKGYDRPDGYVRFLKETKQVVLDLRSECERRDIAIEDLPQKLNRPRSSIPKLIDEYNWVTITKGISIPTLKELLAGFT